MKDFVRKGFRAQGRLREICGCRLMERFQDLHFAFCILHFELQKSRSRWLDIDRNASPFALLEPHETERRTRGVADDDCRPDVTRVESVHRLEHCAQTQRNDHLRDDRDIQRASRVAGPLQPARVAERNGDE